MKQNKCKVTDAMLSAAKATLHKQLEHAMPKLAALLKEHFKDSNDTVEQKPFKLLDFYGKCLAKEEGNDAE